MRLALIILALIVVLAINVFAVRFGADEPRLAVRITSVASGLLGILCVVSIPTAFLHYLLSSIPSTSIGLMKLFFWGSIFFTGLALASSLAIALRLRRNVA